MSIVQAIQTILNQDLRIKLALLFGSYAQGKERNDSDIDIGIAFERNLTLDDQLDYAQRILSETGVEADIIDLRKADGVLLQQIIKFRKILVKRDEELLGNLISKSVVQELDFMPLYDMMLKKRRERFVEKWKKES